MTIELEETVRVNSPAEVRGLGVSHVDGSQRVGGKSGEDVIVEVLHIKHGAHMPEVKLGIYLSMAQSI